MQVDKKSIVIVIPVYRSVINSNEKVSLEQVVKILADYDITFITPESLSFDPSQLLPGNKFLQMANVARFNDRWFSSTIDYSRLLVTREFYEKFDKYRFMLLYQLDAYVFYDGLQHWASKGYDYLGAPWVKEDELLFMKTMCRSKWQFIFSFMRIINKIFFGKKDYAIGNGGLSLRNIPKSLIVLDRLSFLAKKWEIHEDIFWSMAAPILYPFFKVPNKKDAFNFSFEKDPETFFKLNKNKLPFGCHAWEKFSPDFWNKYIPIPSQTR